MNVADIADIADIDDISLKFSQFTHRTALQ